MKKYIFAICALAAAACTPDNSVKPAVYEYVGIKTPSPTSVLEDSGTKLTIPVYYGGQLTNAASFTVPYTITGGVYGTDYTVVGGTAATGTLTIPAGAAGTVAFVNLQIQPVANTTKEPNKVLTVTLGTPSNNVGLNYPLKSTAVLTITDDDCTYVEADYIKIAAGREVYPDNSCYPANCTSTYNVTMTKTGTNTFATNNFWDSGWTITMVVNPANNTFTIASQSPAAGVTVSGSGTIATCSKTWTFTTLIVWPAQSYNGSNTNIYKY